MEKKIDIAIIGAGLSGLTAGWRLFQHGENIRIFEARSRVGGRVHSVTVNNLNAHPSIAELGGQVLTDGGKYLCIKRLLKEFGLQETTYTLNFSRRFYDGQNFYDPHALLKSWISEHYHSKHDFQNAFKKIISQKQNLNNALSVLLRKNQPILKAILTLQCQAYEGGTMDALSVHHHASTLYEMMIGGIASPYEAKKIEEDLMIPCSSIAGGNSKLPESIAQKLKQHVFLSYTLKKVESGENEDITCVFLHNNKECIVHCKKLLLTIPCSVFSSIAFDQKLLSSRRLNLFKKVSYGQHGKIILPFDKNLSSYPALMMKNMGTFSNHDHHLLNLYCIGNYGATLEKKAHNYHKQALSMFRHAFPLFSFKNTLPVKATDITVHYTTPVFKDWFNDPFTQGSYSAFSRTLDGIQDQIITYHDVKVREMFAPENHTIFFAGEHTTLISEIGTMEAAVESGERMAQCLLNISSKQKK